MPKTLIIVESPNKCATLKQFLGDDYVIMASVGHVTKIADTGLYNLGIDVNNGFTPDIIVDPDKKDVVKRLKEQIKLSDKVIICSDPDREGEAIAHNLKTILKIPDSKCARATFHEITKTAVLNALANTRDIDEDMYNAAISRAIIDKIVGYRVSPIAMTKCGCKSVGRVQSAALKILAMREDEITNFVPSKFYEIWLPFKKNKKIYRAQYKGTDKKKMVSIPTKTTAENIIADCIDDYVLKRIDEKDRHLSAKPPFTTSTFQQEVSSKLGYTTKKAMECAQKLFEGINLNGEHVALITYHRTDSTDLNDEFVETLNKFVKSTYGEKYYSPVKKAKKGKNTQDGHEALHVVDLDMTPDKLKSYVDDSQLIKVYKIIYERTVACAMSDCIITDKEFCIYNKNHKFSYTKHNIKFDGFKRVYGYSDEEEEEEKYPDLEINEILNADKLELVEKETTPPSRYTEAGLIKKMEETGIGRPSTYATTLSILQDKDRGYTEKDGKSLKVTEKGMRLSKFLDKSFGDIINLEYTSQMEENLDEISSGKKDRLEFLNSFYTKLNNEIAVAKTTESSKPAAELVGRKCPECGKDLVYREGKYGKFIACTGWSGKKGCHYTEKINDPNVPTKPKTPAEDTGYKCPDCGKPIVKRLSQTGEYWYACSGFPKHKKTFTVDAFKKIVASQSVDKKSKDKS